jgi:hypothetical protein
LEGRERNWFDTGESEGHSVKYNEPTYEREILGDESVYVLTGD